MNEPAGKGFPRLYVISDGTGRDELARVFGEIARVLPPGAVMFQLREKQLPARALCEMARAVVLSLRGTGAPVLVNDRLDVALAAGAEGVHLAGSSVDVCEAKSLGLWVGASTHDAAQLGARMGADFVTFGPVYDTPSKRGMGEPVGEAALVEAARSFAGPVFGLGGITRERAARLAGLGVAGVAVIGAVLGQVDPVGAARALWESVSFPR